MFNDLSVLARIREREIRSGVLARQRLPQTNGMRRAGVPQLARSVAGRLGSALVAVGHRLEFANMEERPEHGS